MDRTLTLALSGLLMTSSLAVAGPKKVPLAPLLTPQERYCRTLGTYAAAVAEDRNRGVPLTTALADSRRAWRAHKVSVATMQVLDTIARTVYRVPDATPVDVQQYTELWCLGLAPDPPASPTGPPVTPHLRY